MVTELKWGKEYQSNFIDNKYLKRVGLAPSLSHTHTLSHSSHTHTHTYTHSSLSLTHTHTLISQHWWGIGPELLMAKSEGDDVL